MFTGSYPTHQGLYEAIVDAYRRGPNTAEEYNWVIKDRTKGITSKELGYLKGCDPPGVTTQEVNGVEQGAITR
jgi:hypothetical protein